MRSRPYVAGRHSLDHVNQRHVHCNRKLPNITSGLRPYTLLSGRPMKFKVLKRKIEIPAFLGHRGIAPSIKTSGPQGLRTNDEKYDRFKYE